MLRVTIELVPHGDESRKKVIAQGEIANAATGTWANGNYTYTLEGELFGHPEFGHESFKGEVLNYPRYLESWDLLYRVLKNAVGHRNPEVL